MEQVNVFKRRGKLFILPASQTTEGVWMGTDPVIQLDETVSHDEQGEAILQTFSSSKQDVPHPLDWNVPTSSLLTVAGVRSWDAFEKTARSVTIERQDNRLRFRPWRNLETGKGYGPVAEEKHVFLTGGASVKEIGAALQKALDCCES